MTEKPDEADSSSLQANCLRAGRTPLLFLGRDGTILELNDASATNLGLTHDQALGQSIFEFLPAMAAALRVRLVRTFTDAASFVVDDVVELPSGQRRFRANNDPVFDQAGRVVAMRVDAVEVTVEHELSVSLSRADHKLALMFEHSPYLILLFDRHGVISYINRPGAGFKLEDVVGTDSHHFVHPDFHPAYDAALRTVFEDRVAAKFECTDIHGSWWEVTLAPVIHEGRVEHGMSFSVDVTEKRRAEAERTRLQEQMQEAQKLESLGVLAGGIAHDFNNLLLVITANTEMARKRLAADPNAAGRHLDDVLSASERAADLCRQMLAYAGRGRFVVERVDLSALVSEMAQLVAVSVSKHVQLQRALATDLPAIEADPTQLRQVVLNLLTNASDAIGDKPGVIAVTTRRAQLGTSELRTRFGADLGAGPYVVLEVADTGHGLDQDTRARMFEPFFSTKASGRGLGLSATLGIIRRHRGAIQVDSTPGEGTRMHVIFPAIDGAPDAGAERSRPRPMLGAGVVLVIDDEAGVRNVAAKVLAHAGYQVVTAGDGREGLERYDAHPGPIRLVLLDLTMPVLGGEATLRELRTRAATLPVIMMSGYVEAVPRGDHVHFLAKPFRVDDLLGVVAEVLGDRPDDGGR